MLHTQHQPFRELFKPVLRVRPEQGESVGFSTVRECIFSLAVTALDGLVAIFQKPSATDISYACNSANGHKIGSQVGALALVVVGLRAVGVGDFGQHGGRHGDNVYVRSHPTTAPM